MKRPLPWLTRLALVAVAAGELRAGDIEGRITAQGRPEAEAGAASAGGYASRRYRFLERVDYAAMGDYVVWLEGGAPPPLQGEPPVMHVVVQKEGTFSPHVLPVQVGTVVEWPNNDDIFHNVFSISDVKPFDLGMYKHPEVKRVAFDKPGRVDIFCSIHKSMHCIVLVLETPWFAAADAKNRYAIRGVPAGAYKLRAWHERLPPQVREVTVPETGKVELDVVMSITGLPQY